jgi:hypothetical protein
MWKLFREHPTNTEYDWKIPVYIHPTKKDLYFLLTHGKCQEWARALVSFWELIVSRQRIILILCAPVASPHWWCHISIPAKQYQIRFAIQKTQDFRQSWAHAGPWQLLPLPSNWAFNVRWLWGR